VNGRFLGKVPIENFKTGIGLHDIVFDHPNYDAVRKEIDLIPGQRVNVEVKFKQEPKGKDPEEEK